MAADKETRDMLAYLQDTLPASRRATFEARLQTDPALRGQLEALRLTTEGLRRLALVHQVGQKRQVITPTRPLWAEPPQRRYGWTTALAASVTIFLLVGVGLYRTYFRNDQRLFEEFYRPDVGFRGAGDANCTVDLQGIVQLYAQKEYDAALARLETLPDQTPACVQYRKGMILLALNESEKAITSLHRAVADSANLPAGESSLRQQAEWYLSLAYLRNGDTNEARSLLSNISKATDHPFYQAAGRVLTQLN